MMTNAKIGETQFPRRLPRTVTFGGQVKYNRASPTNGRASFQLLEKGRASRPAKNSLQDVWIGFGEEFLGFQM